DGRDRVRDVPRSPVARAGGHHRRDRPRARGRSDRDRRQPGRRHHGAAASRVRDEGGHGGEKRRAASAISGVVHFGLAWLALGVAFAIHVADEALTDFLSAYNPAVRSIQARFPFLPLPTFTLRGWLPRRLLAVRVPA